jgi:phosphate uptake regulator
VIYRGLTLSAFHGNAFMVTPLDYCMDIRKLQRTGGGTYILSLPKKWIEKYSLEKGDSFALFEQENGLFITPKFEEKKEKQMETTADEFVSRKIMTSYTYGYTSVKIVGTLTNDIRFSIRDTVDKLLGYEIIDEKEKTILIQDLLNPSELPTTKALKREYFLVSSMHKDLTMAIATKTFELADDIIARDSEVDKLYFLIIRQLRSALQNTGFPYCGQECGRNCRFSGSCIPKFTGCHRHYRGYQRGPSGFQQTGPFHA